MKTNNKLIITGITGKSGQFFLDEILNNPNVVNNFFEEIVFAIHNENKIRDIKEKIEKSASNIKINFIVGDLNDEKYCNRLCENGECLFHIAGIQKSEMLVRCAVEKGIKKIVLVLL